MTDAFEPEILDELLSAELDGELDAAAAERGLDPSAVRARLAAHPGVDARRAALARAARAVAAAEPLDEVTARRIVGTALAAHRRGHVDTAADPAGTTTDDHLAAGRARRRPRWAAIGGLAAAVALLAGAAAVVAGSGSDEGEDAGAPTAAESGTGADGAGAPPLTADLGELADAGALRDAVAATLGVTDGADAAGGAADEAATSTRSAADGAADGAAEAFANPAPAAGGDTGAALPEAARCDGALRDAGAPTAGPTLDAVATLSGTPVRVLAWAAGDEVLVYVLDAGCTVRDVQRLATDG